jgi:DNA mismatch endonuclease, patch repair protein
MPKSRAEFWAAKLGGNVTRDRKNTRTLKSMGWRVLTVWECDLENPKRVADRLARLISEFPEESRPR